MTPEARQTLVEHYAKGPERVAASLKGFPPGGLTARPIPGKWSAAEIIHHLSDSETISATRIRRIIAEAYPVLPDYDQDEYALALRYNERNPKPALENFRAVRAATTQLLRTLTEEEWVRQGWHTEAGLFSAERWLRIYAIHAHDHAEQIDRLRVALGGK